MYSGDIEPASGIDPVEKELTRQAQVSAAQRRILENEKAIREADERGKRK